MEKYEKDRKVGEGTYAVVYLVHDKAQRNPYAMKKFKLGDSKDGVVFAALREIRFLQELVHPNIVKLHEVFAHKSNISMILEYLETDLERVIKDATLRFSPADVKSWMVMTLRAVDYCHVNFLLHRDIKPNNLLIGRDGILKLADFGFARMYEDYQTAMTPRAVTLWYRPPELLLGTAHYGPAIDLWSVGCVFAELMLRVPYFAGNSELEQLSKIFEALGTPTEKDWPGLTELSNGIQFKQHTRGPLKALFTAATDDTLELLAWLLTFDPRKRPTTKEALQHAYFTNLPRPTPPDDLPRPSSPAAVGTTSAPAGEATAVAGAGRKREVEPEVGRKGKQLKFERDGEAETAVGGKA